MRIGMTYDLREDYLRAGFGEEETAEFDRPDTIDGIENALRELGHEPERIGNVTSLVDAIAAGKRWDLVFNICEGLYGIGREAQVPALLDAYRIPYTFSDPLVLSLTLHKGMTKRVIRDLGLATPDFVVVENEADIGKVRLPYPLFAKPLAEGTGKGITADSKIRTPGELRENCRKLLREFRQPVLIETFLSGREFTVGIAGTGEEARVVAIMEVILNAKAEAEVYSYVNKEECDDRVEYRLVKDEKAVVKACEDLCLAAWRGLGCRDAGRIDVRMDANGVMNFIEVNPLAGINPVHSDLPIMCTLAGISYKSLIGWIMESAMRRVKK
jgi:D-alanine-D-alanine ligase